jgi:hypothetical protein
MSTIQVQNLYDQEFTGLSDGAQEALKAGIYKYSGRFFTNLYQNDFDWILSELAWVAAMPYPNISNDDVKEASTYISKLKESITRGELVY